MAVKERGGQVAWLKPQICFWRPLELPELGFTPETRPDAALQRDTGALDDGWDWEANVSYKMERWVCGHVTKSLHFPAGWGGLRHRRCGGPLVGAQSILSSGKLLERGEGMGPAVAGSGGSPPSSYMVVEARLVSSCLSLPSRARPRFSRLAESVGVMEYILEKVELAATVSLEGVGEENSEPAPAWWVLSTHQGCSALRQAPGQSQNPPALPSPRSCLGLFPPFVPLYNHFFFSNPRLCCSPPRSQGHRGCGWPQRCKERRGSSWGAAAHLPQGTSPANTGLCWGARHPQPSLSSASSASALLTLIFLLPGVKPSSLPPLPITLPSSSSFLFSLWPRCHATPSPFLLTLSPRCTQSSSIYPANRGPRL